MTATLATLLLLLVAGDVVLGASGVPVSGPIAGLVILSTAFTARGGATPSAARLFDAIIPCAPLFFVPACVGVVANVDVLARSWFAVVFAIVAGTALTIIIVGLTAQAMFARFAPKVGAA